MVHGGVHGLVMDCLIVAVVLVRPLIFPVAHLLVVHGLILGLLPHLLVLHFHLVVRNFVLVDQLLDVALHLVVVIGLEAVCLEQVVGPCRHVQHIAWLCDHLLVPGGAVLHPHVVGDPFLLGHPDILVPSLIFKNALVPRSLVDHPDALLGGLVVAGVLLNLDPARLCRLLLLGSFRRRRLRAGVFGRFSVIGSRGSLALVAHFVLGV